MSKGRRFPPRRKGKGVLALGREAQAPAGWVPLGELALRMADARIRATGEPWSSMKIGRGDEGTDESEPRGWSDDDKE